MSHVDTEEIVDFGFDIENIYKLVLHNDEVNTFHHIMVSLVEILRMSVTQAEQCALIAHCKGTCFVKESDNALLLEGLRIEFRKRNIHTSIE